MTEKLFYHDPYLTEWTAQISGVEKNGKYFAVGLSASCFYPEGGGQPGDTGMIGRTAVINTIKDGEEIIHLCDSDPGESTVSCLLDWDRRWDYMQQHSGQHILSAVLKQEMDINTLSVHQGREYTAVEIDREDLTEDELALLNQKANELILKNPEIKTAYIDSSEKHKYPLRRPTRRSGKIRIVEISGYDMVACGGVHTAFCGEVRLIQVYALEKMRGRLRILAKIGDRALDDYNLKSRICTWLGNELSSPVESIIEKYQKAKEQQAQLQGRTIALEQMAAELLFKQISAEEIGEVIFFSHCFLDQDPIAVKDCVKIILKHKAAVFCIGNKVNGRLQWQIGCSEDLSLPFTDIRDRLLSAVDGKGGGKIPLWQGYGENPDGFAEMSAIVSGSMR